MAKEGTPGTPGPIAKCTNGKDQLGQCVTFTKYILGINTKSGQQREVYIIWTHKLFDFHVNINRINLIKVKIK